jgi:hypothetical protein
MKQLILILTLVVGAAGWSAAHEGHHHEQPASGPDQLQAPPMRAPVQSELRLFLHHLTQPEYIHVLINPLPLFGMALGAALLAFGLRFENSGLRLGGLALIVLAGLMTYPTVKFGQHAYDRVYETIPLEAQQWLDVHMARAERFQYLFYLTALLGAWALASEKRRMPSAHRQATATLVGAALCAAVAAWISHAGGQVRHEEFREGPPAHNALPREFAVPTHQGGHQ